MPKTTSCAHWVLVVISVGGVDRIQPCLPTIQVTSASRPRTHLSFLCTRKRGDVILFELCLSRAIDKAAVLTVDTSLGVPRSNGNCPPYVEVWVRPQCFNVNALSIFTETVSTRSSLCLLYRVHVCVNRGLVKLFDRY